MCVIIDYLIKLTNPFTFSFFAVDVPSSLLGWPFLVDYGRNCTSLVEATLSEIIVSMTADGTNTPTPLPLHAHLPTCYITDLPTCSPSIYTSHSPASSYPQASTLPSITPSSTSHPSPYHLSPFHLSPPLHLSLRHSQQLFRHPYQCRAEQCMRSKRRSLWPRHPEQSGNNNI